MWRQSLIVATRRGASPYAAMLGPGYWGGTAGAFTLEGYSAHSFDQTPVERKLFVGLRRSGQGSAGFVGVLYSASVGYYPPFHSMLDPATPQEARKLGYEMQDVVYAISAAGANEFAWGLIGSVATNYPDGLVGIGFRWGSDLSIKTFVREGTVVPTTSLHETATGILASTPRHLMLRINGWERTIEWYIDRVLVDSFTPAAVLGQMSSTISNRNVDVRYRALVPASGDATIRYLGEEGEALLTLMDSSPETPELAAPEIKQVCRFASDSVTPSSGPEAGGTEVVIKGSGFAAGATVLFGASAATVTEVLESQITCTSPAGTGVVGITVTNTDGQSATFADAFTYLGPSPWSDCPAPPETTWSNC